MLRRLYWDDRLWYRQVWPSCGYLGLIEAWINIFLFINQFVSESFTLKLTHLNGETVNPIPQNELVCLHSLLIFVLIVQYADEPLFIKKYPSLASDTYIAGLVIAKIANIHEQQVVDFLGRYYVDEPGVYSSFIVGILETQY